MSAEVPVVKRVHTILHREKRESPQRAAVIRATVAGAACTPSTFHDWQFARRCCRHAVLCSARCRSPLDGSMCVRSEAALLVVSANSIMVGLELLVWGTSVACSILIPVLARTRSPLFFCRSRCAAFFFMPCVALAATEGFTLALRVVGAHDMVSTRQQVVSAASSCGARCVAHVPATMAITYDEKDLVVNLLFEWEAMRHSFKASMAALPEVSSLTDSEGSVLIPYSRVDRYLVVQNSDDSRSGCPSSASDADSTSTDCSATLRAMQRKQLVDCETLRDGSDASNWANTARGVPCAPSQNQQPVAAERKIPTPPSTIAQPQQSPP